MDTTPTPADDVARIQESLKLEREKVRLLRYRIDRVREYIYNEFPDANKDVQESMKIVADLLCIAMTKDVEVDIHITYHATVTLNIDDDISVIGEADIDVEVSSDELIDIDGYITEIDVTEV
jgi:uncharacterized metal-binding protein YceD (DUF177 family)